MTEIALNNSSFKDNIDNTGVTEDTLVAFNSFESFKSSFPLHGEKLYSTVFERNADVVQTQKRQVAITNLEKILNATFYVSATSGFDRMSLRDLSRQTGMSMGAIYSCISKKEDIAMMIADIVRLSSELIRDHAQKSESPWQRIEQSIRYHLYASTLLQSWYFFLYFETRSLPEEQQQNSIQIEVDAIELFEQQIKEGIKAGNFETQNPNMVANTIVVLLEDWYLKPWKTQVNENKDATKQIKTIDQLGLKQEQNINSYHHSVVDLVKKLLAVSS